MSVVSLGRSDVATDGTGRDGTTVAGLTGTGHGAITRRRSFTSTSREGTAMTLDIGEAARFPTESEDWVKTVLIGGVLLLFSFLIVPALAVYGYLLDVLRGGIDGAREPPVFEDWGDRIVAGVVAIVVALIYGLVPFLVFAVTAGGGMAAMATGSEVGVGAGLLTILGGTLVAGLLALAFGYVGVAGLANYATTGRFGAAFDVDTIRAVATNREYAVHWLAGAAVLFAAVVVTGVLNFVPLLGAIVGVFVSFYAQVVAWRVWGEGFAAATGAGATSGDGDRGDDAFATSTPP